MLTEKGVRTALVLSLESMRAEAEWLSGFDAVVLGTQIRALPPADARVRTAAAIECLTALGVEKLQLKYCSTFDSTPQGNIGCSLDAGLEALGQRATIVAPALPVNGRTTYNGYHFVNGVLLSESPLRDHPLTPMTDPNLVRWLQHQTERRVEVVRLEDVRQGPEHLRAVMERLVAEGVSYLVTDAISQSDLGLIAEATGDWRFISGGSGITAEMPRLVFPGRQPLDFSERIRALPNGVLVVSGSQSPATRAQNSCALANGFAGVPVEPGEVLTREFDPAQQADKVADLLGQGRAVILFARADSPEDVRETQELGRKLGLSVVQTGAMVSDALAATAVSAMESGRAGRLIVSGGETSGAVCAAAGLGTLEVGLPVDPGVPYCFPHSHADLMVVLKSGNFGREDFYLRVMNLQ
jgi:uncharacterized protein YgbK (DUF1537 family)